MATALLTIGLAGSTAAETLVAARTIRAQTVLVAEDLMMTQGEGVAPDPLEVIGLEARVAIYQGRPIRPQDLGPAAIIDRNQIVQLSFHSGSLTISAEGRALSRGGVGDRIRVMNIASRTTVTGTVMTDGSVNVMPDR